MIVSQSLFEPASGSTLQSAGDWITGLLSGPAVTVLCVIAVAMLGMTLLTGRLSIRRGIQVVLGCFLLFGSSTIATGLHEAGQIGRTESPKEIVITPMFDLQNRRPLPPANNNPNAGASLRRD